MQWNPSETQWKDGEEKRGSEAALNEWRKPWSKKKRERKRERECERFSFPFPCDRVLWQFSCWQTEQRAVIARVHYRACVKFDISILKYWDINIILTKHKLLPSNWILDSTGSWNVLANLIMLCHGREPCNDVKTKGEIKWQENMSLSLEIIYPSTPCVWLWRQLTVLEISTLMVRTVNVPIKPHRTCQPPPVAPTPHLDTHLCSAHSTSSALLFLLVQLLCLAFLNNSVQVRITISYSILNMPKGQQTRGRRPCFN